MQRNKSTKATRGAAAKRIVITLLDSEGYRIAEDSYPFSTAQRAQDAYTEITNAAENELNQA